MEGFSIVIIVAIVGLAYLIVGRSSAVGEIMGRLSNTDIQGYASNAGFQGDDLNTAVAIALAESSGNPNAMGDPTLGTSVGLWQINLAAHPEYTQEELLDPQTNANAAYDVYSQAGGFSPWTTYKTGAYQRYLSS